MKKYLNVLGAVFASLLLVSLAACNIGQNPGDNPAKSDPAETPVVTPEETPEEKPEETPAVTPEGYIKFDTEYKAEDGSTLQISSENVYKAVSWGTTTTGTVLKTVKPEGYEGTVVIVKYDSHLNYGAECYPDYDEDKWEGSVVDEANYGAITHNGCFSAVYIEKTSDTAIKMAQAVWHVEGEPVGYTACAKTLEGVEKLFETAGYKDTCGAGSTVYTIAE